MEYSQIFLFSSMLVLVYSSEWTVPPETNMLEGRPDECYDKEYHVGYLKHNQEITGIGCILVKCRSDSSIQYVGCPALINCNSYQADYSKLHPHCCPKCLH